VSRYIKGRGQYVTRFCVLPYDLAFPHKFVELRQYMVLEFHFVGFRHDVIVNSRDAKAYEKVDLEHGTLVRTAM
jgi:hypothetical protein